MKEFHSHGKILLSAEYLVLHGALALAIPLNRGQSMCVDKNRQSPLLKWKALDEGSPWFRASLDPDSLEIKSTSNEQMARRLAGHLKECLALRPVFRDEMRSARVCTNLEFSSGFGFGSSSTLVDLLASWADIDPMDLHFRTSGGSGYDVACSRAEGPILYRMENKQALFERVDFSPPFLDCIYFVWLGHKQDTAGSLENIRDHFRPGSNDIDYFTQLTEEMLLASDLSEFRRVMEEHEDALAGLLCTEPIVTKFPGLDGSVKSLGAWGGDFVMIATEMPEEALSEYLKDRGMNVVFPFHSLVHNE